MARDPPVGRLETHDAAQRRRLPDRATRVRPESPPALAGGDSRSRAAGGAAGDAVQVPGLRVGP